MTEEKQRFGRYVYIRSEQSLWGGDPGEAGSRVRQFFITSNQMASTDGPFQVYALEGAGGGITDGKLTMSGEPKLLFDKDLEGFDAATKQFGTLVDDSKKLGLKERSPMEILEFEDRLRRARGGD
jgi:hypothetical protein